MPSVRCDLDRNGRIVQLAIGVVAILSGMYTVLAGTGAEGDRGSYFPNVFSETDFVLNLGTIVGDGTIVATVLDVTNAGPEPLHLAAGESDCTCLSPILPNSMLAPGETGGITLQLLVPYGATGPAYWEQQFITSDGDTPMFVARIYAETRPPIEVSPAKLTLSFHGQEGVAESEVTVICRGTPTVRPRVVGTDLMFISGEIEKSNESVVEEETRETYVLRVPQANTAPGHGNIRFELESSRNSHVLVPVSIEAELPLKPSQSTILLRTPKLQFGRSYPFEVTFTGAVQALQRDFRVTCGDARVHASISPGAAVDQYLVRGTFEPISTEILRTTVQIVDPLSNAVVGEVRLLGFVPLPETRDANY